MAADRQLFLWTVNEDNMMKWSIQKEVDGVITDDPKKFNEICDDWDDNEPAVRISWAQWAYAWWIYVLVLTFGTMFRLNYLRKPRRLS